MDAFKIVKEIHTYNGKIIFRIYEKIFFQWLPMEEYDEYDTLELAEADLIKNINGKHGGIIQVDGNIYKFYPLSFPTP